MGFPLPPASCEVETPASLAEAMVSRLNDDSKARWLDPCVGAGAFLLALHAAEVPVSHIRGFDIQRKSATADHLARVDRGVDFLKKATETRERFDRIVANPPYVSFTRLDDTLRRRAREISAAGMSLSDGANYWAAFLVAAVGLLREGGKLCFVLPAAYEFADYAKPLRDRLPHLFRNVEVHRSRVPLFPDVQEGTVVLLAEGFGKGETAPNRFVYPSKGELIKGLTAREISNNGSQTAPRSFSKGRPTRPLHEVVKIGIGAVTGDNSFFLMTDAERRGRHIPTTACRAVISRAKHLSSSEIDDDLWTKLRQDGERVWMFDPPPRMELNEHVKAYLSLPAEGGGCQRRAYKVANRDKWFRVPVPTRADGFMSGMSHVGPWIALNRIHRLIATNTLYIVHFKETLSLEARASWAIAMLTSEARERFEAAGRCYADGLVKYEPRDLLNVRIPTPSSTRNARSALKKSVNALLTGDTRASRRIADNWISSHVSSGATSSTAQETAA